LADACVPNESNVVYEVPKGDDRMNGLARKSGFTDARAVQDHFRIRSSAAFGSFLLSEANPRQR
jgi:hypothetical protein